MKSNEEFIAGIYKKAEKIQAEDTAREDHDVIRLDSYSPKDKIHKRIKRGYGFAVGIAACLACAVGIYTGTHLLNGKRGADFSEMRASQGGEQIISLSDGRISQRGNQSRSWDFSQYLHGMIGEKGLIEGVYHIAITLIDGTQGMLIIPEDMLNPAIQTGKELVLRVYEPDVYGQYTVVPESEVYVYSSTKDGEKVFISEKNTILYEHELEQ